MLVLSRKSDQEIRIGDDIRLTVLKVKGNTVRIGIEAPSEVRIMRGELIGQEISIPRQKTIDKRQLTVRFGQHEVEDEARVQIIAEKNAPKPEQIIEPGDQYETSRS
jgi:carbon storage regulator